MSLNIEKERKKDHIIFHIKGILDFSTIHIFLNVLEEIKETEVLVVDFTYLEFIDSTGIGAIIDTFYYVQEKGMRVKLEGINEITFEIFDTVGLFQILEAVQGEVI